MSRHPFEVGFSEIQANPELYVSLVFSNLVSEFLIMPKGEGFVEYSAFEAGYEKLKQATSAFQRIAPDAVLNAVLENPISLIVLRAMLGFSPSEWAYLTSQRTGNELTQSFARSLDRSIRLQPNVALRKSGTQFERLKLMIDVACHLLAEGPPETKSDKIHRLDKADTKATGAIETVAGMGVPYAMLLYERFLGRPFAGHRDSVSELVGDNLESAIEEVLTKAGISFRKTKRAERIAGFDQAPDFIVPDEFTPKVIIEAKITEDDGTARDKVTRIQHLSEISLKGALSDEPRFEVVACIGGRGFGVRREDMRKMLFATRGKVFTLKTLDRLVEHSGLKAFRTKFGQSKIADELG